MEISYKTNKISYFTTFLQGPVIYGNPEVLG